MTVLCHSGKARLLAEREWFPGQEGEWLPDGTLRLAFPAVPRPELVWWVLSYAGQIEVVHPDDLREEVRQCAERLVDIHGALANPVENRSGTTTPNEGYGSEPMLEQGGSHGLR